MAKRPKKKRSDDDKPVADVEAPAGDAVDDDDEDGQLATLSRESDEDSLRQLMSVNFIEYASYVIKDRAIPDVYDGLKPVQRRILHSLHVMDDGRFHKVANVIGHTMQYHPHGDMSIGNALVVLANKEYFIDKQGNFGNILTGDRASASRYIECRLSPLAREVLFNPEITEFVDSYDGRNREPVVLPSKVPSLLMIGSDGIAVGMTTRVLPHNFCELLEAEIAILEGNDFRVYPDFLSAGIMDVDEYDDGAGRVVVRAKLDIVNDKTIVIREIPPTTTTESLMNSVEEAARRGKIKIAGINDYTAENVEIEITLPRGIYAKETVKQLYAYTNCEVSISSNLVVIHNNRPETMMVSQILHLNTKKLLADLKRELEIELGKLQDRFHDKTLAQIFIENRIYKRIEECETYETVLSAVRKGLEKFRDMLKRDITDEDIEKLLQIQIRRISLFDINKNREEIDKILLAIEEVQRNLRGLKNFAIRYIQGLLKKYGHLYPRRTQIADLESIDVRKVALHNIRVGHDRVNHFVGTDVRNSNKNEEALVCTEFDKLVLLRNDGKFKVIPIPDKQYVGPVKYLLKVDKNQVYSMVYRDRKKKIYYAKRFQIDSFIMDRDYSLLPSGCIIEGLYTNYGIVLRCEFEPNNRLKYDHVDLDFETIPVRSKGARGIKITHHPVRSFIQEDRGTAEPLPETPENDGAEADEESPDNREDTGATESPTPPSPEPPPAPQLPTGVTVQSKKKSRKKASPPADETSNSDTETEAEGSAGENDSEAAPEESSDSESKRTSKGSKKAGQTEKDDDVSAKRRVAEEWEERSAKASGKKGPAGKSKETAGGGKTGANDESSSKKTSGEKAKPSAAEPQESKRTLPRLIDEETPFFLE